MTPEEFLNKLSRFSKVFDLSVEYKYTEEQLVLFAKLYHESELKKLRVGDVSGQLPLDFVKWYSGMEEEKILKAYERWKSESGNLR